MTLPKKITPDNLKNAFVEVRYSSKLPFELLLGIFVQAFDSNWNYTNRPGTIRPGAHSIQPPGGAEIAFHLGVESMLYNKMINIRLLPNSFVFSCLTEPYLGWGDYANELAAALRVIQNTGQIQQWNRVGVRYISHYPELDLQSCFKFSFSFGRPEIKSESIAFKSEFLFKGAKIILNFSGLVPLATIQPNQTQPVAVVKTSIIDIDVIQEGLRLATLDELLKVIENNHTLEKDLYFGMINDDYLQTLKPQY